MDEKTKNHESYYWKVGMLIFDNCMDLGRFRKGLLDYEQEGTKMDKEDQEGSARASDRDADSTGEGQGLEDEQERLGSAIEEYLAGPGPRFIDSLDALIDPQGYDRKMALIRGIIFRKWVVNWMSKRSGN